MNKHRTDANSKTGENYSRYKVQRSLESSLRIERWSAGDAAAEKRERCPQACHEANNDPYRMLHRHPNRQKTLNQHILKHRAIDVALNPIMLEIAIEQKISERQCHDVDKEGEPREKSKGKQEQCGLNQR
jgi:hypothetical protein